MVNPAEAQADYYNKTASDYENMRGSWDDLLHDEALCIMLALCQKHNVHSILDVGAGTGRIISRIAQTHPDIKTVAIEPVAGLRDQGYANGISREALIDEIGRAHV